LAISPDGRWAATAGWGPLPDGQRVKIWDVTAGRLLASLNSGNARVAISPDGRWLGVGSSSRYQFVRAGSWDTVAEVSTGTAFGAMPLAFHPGGRLAAVLANGDVGPAELVEVETGHVLAAFEPPESARTYALAFSPDGRYLAVAQHDQRVHIWDLARIRRRLDELGLAAGLPDVFGGVAARADSTDDPEFEGIEVVGADPAGLRWLTVRRALREGWFEFLGMFDPDLDDREERLDRAQRWIRLGRWRLAAVDYRAVLARRPDSVPGRGQPAREPIADAAELASVGQGEGPAAGFAKVVTDGTLDVPDLWFEGAILSLAAGDAPGYRMSCRKLLQVLHRTGERVWLELAAHANVLAPEGPAEQAQALQLAERRASTMPSTWSDHVLGLALYRDGQYADSAARIRRSLDLDPNWICCALNWLVLAMDEHRLGRPDEARRWLERADRWVEVALRGRPGGADRGIPQGWHWRDGILLHLLLNEARALIGRGAPGLPEDVFAEP
jgi:hypothetical protein